VTERGRAPVLVIGVGNELRGDDAAGIAVARRLRDGPPAEIDVELEQNDPTALIERWRGRDAVVLVDAVASGAKPGAISRLELSNHPIRKRLHGSSSSHAVGLDEAVELARALRQLPSRVVAYVVQGRRFEAGAGLSPEVAAVIPALADRVLDEARALDPRADGDSV
jgi:hydrogenase maturation protease